MAVVDEDTLAWTTSGPLWLAMGLEMLWGEVERPICAVSIRRLRMESGWFPRLPRMACSFQLHQ